MGAKATPALARGHCPASRRHASPADVLLGLSREPHALAVAGGGGGDRGLDEAVEDDEGGEADVMDVIDAEITVPKITLPEEITSWSRNDDEGSSVDVSVITNIKPVEFEDVQFESDDDTNDDEAYVNDGHVAPLGEEELDDDEGFFV
ncbi:hypothetical protein ZWY2020_055012 [Hordeum vulgare]|nr:hypothetical protein ZWY2020_055012 [Hordeum vulgare]